MWILKFQNQFKWTQLIINVYNLFDFFCSNTFTGLLQNISLEIEDFVETWFPGSLSLSHPVPYKISVPYKYNWPTCLLPNISFVWWCHFSWWLIRYYRNSSSVINNHDKESTMLLKNSYQSEFEFIILVNCNCCCFWI